MDTKSIVQIMDKLITKAGVMTVVVKPTHMYISPQVRKWLTWWDNLSPAEQEREWRHTERRLRYQRQYRRRMYQ